MPNAFLSPDSLPLDLSSQHPPNILRNNPLPRHVGMDTVALVERVHARHALEQKRDEREVVLFGELGVDASEGGGVRRTEIGRRLHGGEEDLRLGVRRADAVDDRLEVGAEGVHGKGAQAVVRAHLEHDDVHRLAHEPVNAAQRASRGLAAHSGVDHLVV